MNKILENLLKLVSGKSDDTFMLEEEVDFKGYSYNGRSTLLVTQISFDPSVIADDSCGMDDAKISIHFVVPELEHMYFNDPDACDTVVAMDSEDFDQFTDEDWQTIYDICDENL